MSAELSTTGKIAEGEYVNEWVDAGNGQWVNKFSILTTRTVCYEVYEPRRSGFDANGHYFSTHSSYTHHEDMCLGDITMREIPPLMNALPAYSEERARAVIAWYDANKAQARALVLAAFPADFD